MTFLGIIMGLAAGVFATWIIMRDTAPRIGFTEANAIGACLVPITKQSLVGLSRKELEATRDELTANRVKAEFVAAHCRYPDYARVEALMYDRGLELIEARLGADTAKNAEESNG